MIQKEAVKLQTTKKKKTRKKNKKANALTKKFLNKQAKKYK